VVPTIYYQLFVPFVDFAFPVCYALMTEVMYLKLFQKVQQLVPQFAWTCAMADFEASVAGFQHVYPGVAGCWVSLCASNNQNRPPLFDLVVQITLILPGVPPLGSLQSKDSGRSWRYAKIGLSCKG